jgi:hypothetical protein
LQPLHDRQPLAWVAGIGKSWEGKKGLLGLEKLDAFGSIGLSVQVMKLKEELYCVDFFFRFNVNVLFDIKTTFSVKLI